MAPTTIKEGAILFLIQREKKEVRKMIQDIFPKHLDNQYKKEVQEKPEDIVLCFDGAKVLVKVDDTNLEFPKRSMFGKDTELRYLFSIDEDQYFLYETKNEAKVASIDIFQNYEYIDVRALRQRGMSPKYHIYAAMTGKHLADWYRDNQFCGRCGSRMKHSDSERAMKCECGYTSYPRIMPAVIVGVKNGDKLLLTRYRNGYQHNALIAGFVEIGETVEETVVREVMEEAGIHVKNITYYKSQPWGVANDILVGYYCEVDGNTEIHMDSEELKYAEWVQREDIVLQPDDFSLTNEMMYMFKTGKM